MPGAAQLDEFRRTLEKRAGKYGIDLKAEEITRLGQYYELLWRWNPRLHLVAPCSPAEFATRHVLESLMLLPHFTPQAQVADIGSGAGLPIIPALTARSDIRALLIESSPRKTVFLREALSVTGTSPQAAVIAARFESIPAPEIDFVTCRALDRFAELFPRLVQWAPTQTTFLLFGGQGLQNEIELAGLTFSAVQMPGSAGRFLYLCRRVMT